jgi:oxaloacetate decarboxylase alpha subunit
MSVKIVETCLRDGHQSLIATRLTTNEILEIVEVMDQAGYYSMEVWGGATYDSCLRFLNEDPWVRLREIKKRVKNTKLQMLLRGQNLLGYKHYSDDVVELFIKKAIENGIDIIRVFDALNDIRNLESSINAIKKYNGHCQIALSYTTSDVHTIDYYVELAKEVESLGVDSICIKDMAGVLLPEIGYNLIKQIKEVTTIPIELHTHQTSGTGGMLYLKAVEAGIDIIDTAISPLSGGTSQPSTESMYYALGETVNKTDLRINQVNKVAQYFTKVTDKYLQEGILNPKALMTNPNILKYQVPGGMLSNLMSQLKSQNAIDKYEDVLIEVPRVRADLGYPPLVTPLSQMVGTQAVMNVLTGSRYKMIPKEIKDYVRGLYGRAPVKISDEIRKIIIGDQSIIDHRPADDLGSMIEQVKEEFGDLADCDENLLSLALFPNIAEPFLRSRNNQNEDEIIHFEILI